MELMLALPPERSRAGAAWGLPLVHMAYRVGAGGHLYRANMAQMPRGGLLGIEAPEGIGSGQSEGFCGELLRECAARHASGVVLELRRREEGLARLCGQVSRACKGRGLTCFVREAYALAAPEAEVLVSTALSGGSLAERLERAQQSYGRERVALWAEPVAEDFLLPSPTGAGESLSREELLRRRRDWGRGNVFFSGGLCAHYFTYQREGQGHFVLFDDGASMKKKLALAGELGIRRAILPYDRVEGMLEQLLER